MKQLTCGWKMCTNKNQYGGPMHIWALVHLLQGLGDGETISGRYGRVMSAARCGCSSKENSSMIFQETARRKIPGRGSVDPTSPIHIPPHLRKYLKKFRRTRYPRYLRVLLFGFCLTSSRECLVGAVVSVPVHRNVEMIIQRSAVRVTCTGTQLPPQENYDFSQRWGCS